MYFFEYKKKTLIFLFLFFFNYGLHMIFISYEHILKLYTAYEGRTRSVLLPNTSILLKRSYPYFIIIKLDISYTNWIIIFSNFEYDILVYKNLLQNIDYNHNQNNMDLTLINNGYKLVLFIWSCSPHTILVNDYLDTGNTLLCGWRFEFVV